MINTPYTVRNLHKKVSSVKKMLGHSNQASLIPSIQALDELIKGCELAIYNSAMLLKKLHDLRAETKAQRLNGNDLSDSCLLVIAFKFKRQGT
jgi:hypothetical protein